MKITMDLIFTKLFMEQPQMSFDISSMDKNKALTGVRLLPVEKIHLKYDCLYVCDSTHPILEDGIPGELSIVCIQNTHGSTVKNTRHAFIKSGMEVALFLNILQEIYVNFKDWHSRLERMVIENATIQSMIDVSEDIINAPFLIYDPSLKIIGGTQNIHVEDRIFNDVVSRGYLPNEYIKFFEEEKIFLNLNRKGATESEPKALREHRDYIRIIQTATDVLGHGAMLLLDTKTRDYHIYLFNTLCDLILDNLKLHNAQTAVYDYILTDILNGALTDEATISDRLKYVDLPFTGNYALMLLRFQDHNSVPLRFIINSLSSLLPLSKVFSYESDILVLLRLHDLSEEKYMNQIDSAKSAIDRELKERRLRCSVSKSFDQITKITTAYTQCRAVYDLEPNQKKPWMFYENYWLYHLFEICNTAVSLEDFVNPVIYQIAAKKQTGTASPLEILRAYLECERQLTPAAEKLHMHRNNVLYHVSKLEKEYNLELDNSDKRLHLLISLKIYDFVETRT